MSISINRSLRHMAWANQAVFHEVSKLPVAALDVYLSNPKWTVKEILHHICDGATWYLHRLEIEHWQEIPEVNSASDVVKLGELIAEFDQKLISASNQDDRELTYKFEDKDKTVVRWFSTILTQAVHHATEHRAQLVDALDFHSYRTINLDNLDLWGFDMFERGELPS